MDTLTPQLDLKTLMDIHKREIFASLHCHKPGTIQEFHPATQTATISINHKAVVGDVIMDYPMLYEVPVFVPAGGNAALTMPIREGDSCLVLFSDRDIDAWFSQGYTDATPPTPRKHNIADGFAIVGFRPKTNPLTDYNPAGVELRNADGRVVIDDEGFISIRRGNNDLHELIKKLIDCLKTFKVISTDEKKIISVTYEDTSIALDDIKTKFGELLK
jgi:hypothetical protein